MIWTSVGAYGQSSPKYSNEFLSMGVGARSLGMGGAYTSTASDVTSAYWNPALLVEISFQYQIAAMHAEYFSGIGQYDYLGFATRIDSLSSLGVSMLRFGVDDIPDTRFLYDANGAIDYNNIRFFSAADYGFLFSYARRMDFLKGLFLGGNMKIVHRIAGSFATAWGFGVDLSAYYRWKGWQLGVMGRDITGTFNAWSHNSDLVMSVYNQTGNIIPESSIEVTLPKLITGVSREMKISDAFDIITSLDFQVTFDGKRNTVISSDPISLDPRLGLEAGYKETGYLRIGFNNYQLIKDFDGSTRPAVQWNLGLGATLENISVDYALSDFGDPSGNLYTHIFSLMFSWD